jgi:hypothetical protein
MITAAKLIEILQTIPADTKVFLCDGSHLELSVDVIYTNTSQKWVVVGNTRTVYLYASDTKIWEE